MRPEWEEISNPPLFFTNVDVSLCLYSGLDFFLEVFLQRICWTAVVLEWMLLACLCGGDDGGCNCNKKPKAPSTTQRRAKVLWYHLYLGFFPSRKKRKKTLVHNQSHTKSNFTVRFGLNLIISETKLLMLTKIWEMLFGTFFRRLNQLKLTKVKPWGFFSENSSTSS